MAKVYTEEELNSFSRETLMAVILSMQDQISQLNTNMERLIEQIADANNKRYGRSSEKLETISGQMELELIFNEAEALTETLYVVEPAEEDVIQPRHRKNKGKREADLKDLPIEVIVHTLSEENSRMSLAQMDGNSFQTRYIKGYVCSRQSILLKNIMWQSTLVRTTRQS
ncbi:MAG: transposase domain-containing protein [Blautia wexlerae]